MLAGRRSAVRRCATAGVAARVDHGPRGIVEDRLVSVVVPPRTRGAPVPLAGSARAGPGVQSQRVAGRDRGPREDVVLLVAARGRDDLPALELDGGAGAVLEHDV